MQRNAKQIEMMNHRTKKIILNLVTKFYSSFIVTILSS